MPASLPLSGLQRWMQAVVVHPGRIEEAVAAPAAASELGRRSVSDVVLPSRLLTPEERVGVYHGMYLIRMEEALAIDYPGLKHFLGEDAFWELVRDYVQVHPSRSYTLNRLGDHLPEFLESAGGVARRDFCADLARLELAVTEAFDEEETERLSDASIAAVSPEDWERAVLSSIAALRLVACRYNVNEYLDSLKADAHRHPRPRRKASWVVVFRSDYAVYRLDLTREAHDLLADLVAGVPLGKAVAAALLRGRRERPGEEELFRWFRQWIGHGLFRAVALA
jgi:Putative DNA-binding domain